jgi:hypothetical protein
MSYPRDLKADHIGAAGNSSSYEPQRANNATLYIYNVTGGIGNGDGTLQLSLKSFSGPTISNDIKQVRYMNEARKFAGIPNFGDLDVMYRDNVDVAVVPALLKWRSQVYDPSTGYIGFKKNYAKRADIIIFAPDNSISRTYNLMGVWPSSFSHANYDADSDELVNISLRLSVDKWTPGDGFAGSTSPNAVG